ncbi:MAG: hypothetical protein MI861_16285, partial [Pirellulales bacterium]|nr:hypothetical protein [Pirellulales bacterium]
MTSIVSAADFNRDIRPILSDKCFMCHGPDEHERHADLRVDTPEGAYSDLGGYAAIVPGDLDASEAWQRMISDDPDQVMPPSDSNKSLTAKEKEIIRQWIEQGAQYQQHWSLVAPTKDDKVQGHPVDHFVTRQLNQAGLTLSPRADLRTLIRRVTLD